MIRIAFFWGIISAVSLPLGAWIGLIARPGKKITSALMSFGAGALLFALTIELFAEALHHGREHGNELVVLTIAGALLGGLLFDFLNQILNNRGAFLRKLTITKKYLTKLKTAMSRKLILELSRVRLLQSLPPQDIAKLVMHMKKESFDAGETIFHEGELGSTLYFIISGEVEILKKDQSGHEQFISLLKENDTFGEMALLSHRPRNATARVKTETLVLKALHSDFNSLLAESEILREKALILFNQRAEELSTKTSDYQIEEWKSECLKHLVNIQIHLTDYEITEESKKAALKKGAAFAIWLGILLDGIPESLIIGMLSARITGISLSFIAGVFLANLPEAMSSAVGMRRSGMGFWKILCMWGSLCLITGMGAVIGAILFPAQPAVTDYYLIAGIQGLAAGAMLTMIAETMLPEAFEQGGAIVGFSTLLGFLTTLVVKIL